MNKKELIYLVSKVTHVTRQDVDLIITSTLETIIATVARNESVRLVGFGSFSVRGKKLKYSFEECMLASTSPVVVKFSAGKFFRRNLSSMP
jgi:DNA-binding protein HU-beta